MFLPVVFCVLFLQNIFGSPILETDEDPEWLARYRRDFEIFDSDHWYKWWYGGKRKSTIQERIQTLETRQKVVFDLVLCESHNRLRTFVTDECELFRKKAEQVFEVPAKGTPGPDDAKIKTPSTMATNVSRETTAVPPVTTAVPPVTTAVPQVTTSSPQEVTTGASSNPPVSTSSSVVLSDTTPPPA